MINWFSSLDTEMKVAIVTGFFGIIIAVIAGALGRSNLKNQDEKIGENRIIKIKAKGKKNKIVGVQNTYYSGTTRPQNICEELKYKISKSLTLYADVLSNPIDLANTSNCKLPQAYENAHVSLRELASEVAAVAETVGDKELSMSKKDLMEVSRCLIGLSNGLSTGFRTFSYELTSNGNKQLENELRKLLNLPKLK